MRALPARSLQHVYVQGHRQEPRVKRSHLILGVMTINHPGSPASPSCAAQVHDKHIDYQSTQNEIPKRPDNMWECQSIFGRVIPLNNDNIRNDVCISRRRANCPPNAIRSRGRRASTTTGRSWSLGYERREASDFREDGRQNKQSVGQSSSACTRQPPCRAWHHRPVPLLAWPAPHQGRQLHLRLPRTPPHPRHGHH